LESLIALAYSLSKGTDPVERLVGPHEEGFSKGGETSHVGRSVELVLADHIEGLGWLDDRRYAGLVGKVEEPACVGRGGAEFAIQSLAPVERSGQGIDAGKDSSVVDHVEFLPNEDGGRHFRSSVEPPGKLGRFFTLVAKGKNFRFHETGREVDHAVTGDGTGDVGKAEVAILDFPKLAPCLRIVSVHPVGAAGNQDGLAIEVFDDRGGIGFLELRVFPKLARALGFPGDFATVLIKSDDVLPVAAVQVEDHQVIPNKWRASGAVFVHHPKGLVLVLPEELARFCIDACIAVGSEVKVDLSAFNDRCGGGIAIELVHPLGLLLFQNQFHQYHSNLKIKTLLQYHQLFLQVKLNLGVHY